MRETICTLTTFRTHPGTPNGLNVLLMSKLIHLGSFATNFGDKIIKKVNFQKLTKIGPLGPLLGPLPGPLWVSMSF